MSLKLGFTDIMSFKPYYKWITFNTGFGKRDTKLACLGFKPYYKWITFNTRMKRAVEMLRSYMF